MARPVRIRLTYTADRARLARLEEAIEKDGAMSAESRTEALDLLRRLSKVLVVHDAKRPADLPPELLRKKKGQK